MTYNLIITPKAHSQIESHYIFYKNNVSKTVAQKFQKELLSSYKSLIINPFYKRYNDNYRVFPLSKFPFIIFYELDEIQKLIKIVAVFNTKQDTSKYPHP